ncbi:MAG: cupredoxin domain-containing protein, partial [Nitrosospira sp.]
MGDGTFFCYIDVNVIMLKKGVWESLRKGEYMKHPLIVSALTLGLISAGTSADESHPGGDSTVGSPGDLSKVSRTIEITMVENRFKPSEIKVKQGETIKFVLKNTGKKKHEIMIGTPDEIDKHGKMMKK